MDAVTLLVPVLAGFVVGWLLRRLGIAGSAEGETLFKLVFYVCSPALSFAVLAKAHIGGHLLLFSATAFVSVATGYLAGRLVRRSLRLSPTRAPVFLLTSMIGNTGFALPFIEAVYGSEGLVRLAAFDMINATSTFSISYLIAAHANPEHEGHGVPVGKLLRSPPLYGIAIGIVVGVAGWHVPAVAMNTADVFGSATGLLLTLAIGLVFNPSRANLRLAAVGALTRLVTGFAVALAMIVAFGLDGVDRGVLLLMGVAPVGINAVTFASLEKLDVEFAAQTLSLSLVVSLVLSTVVAFLLV